MKKILLLEMLLLFIVSFSYSQPVAKSYVRTSAEFNQRIKDDTLKKIYLNSGRFWLPLSPLIFTWNRYSIGGSKPKEVGIVGRNIRGYISHDPIALKHLNKYRNQRLFGLAQMWLIFPVGMVTAMSYANANPRFEDNTPAYLVIGSTAFYASGAIFYHFIARKHLKNAIQIYNRNRKI